MRKVSGVFTRNVTQHILFSGAAGLASVFNEWAGCEFAQSKQFILAPYFFPCIVEYVLIMAAIAYKMYFNVGATPHDGGHEEVPRGTWTAWAKISYTSAALLGIYP